jgi:hypothetical protein
MPEKCQRSVKLKVSTMAETCQLAIRNRENVPVGIFRADIDIYLVWLIKLGFQPVIETGAVNRSRSSYCGK